MSRYKDPPYTTVTIKACAVIEKDVLNDLNNQIDQVQKLKLLSPNHALRNNCDLLTITSFACDPEALRARKGVVVSARVHPGESNASHMMKGVIDYLTGPSLDAKILRYVQN